MTLLLILLGILIYLCLGAVITGLFRKIKLLDDEADIGLWIILWGILFPLLFLCILGLALFEIPMYIYNKIKNS